MLFRPKTLRSLRLVVKALLLFFSLTESASASIWGPSRENACWQSIKTIRKYYPDTPGVSQYTLNIFSGLRDQFKSRSNQPQIESGYAKIASGQAIQGTLNDRQISSRLQAILNLLQSKSPPSFENESSSQRTMAFSLKGKDRINQFLDDFEKYNRLATRYQRVGTPIQGLYATLIYGAYYYLGQNFIDNLESINLAAMGAFFFLSNGVKGLTRAWPLYPSVRNEVAQMKMFIEQPLGEHSREFLLLSHSATLPKGLFNLSKSNFAIIQSLNEDQLIPFEQILIFAQRIPIRPINFSRHNSDEEWVHVDFLFEKDQDENFEVHILVQHSDTPPRFSKKNKDWSNGLRQITAPSSPLAHPI